MLPLAIAGKAFGWSPATTWRKCAQGVRVGTQRIHLDALCFGRRWFTSEAAIVDFGRRVAAAKAAEFAGAPTLGGEKPSTQIPAASPAAERCDKAGW